jgi:CDP-diacylglycerol--serine O-phosphatidyltransferase
MLRALPNTLTLCNLFAGSCAIAALFEGKPMITLYLAAACLVLDVLDGLLARRLNVSGELGSQLDSLADLVSFGVLPSCILFELIRRETQPELEILPYVAFVFGAAVAVRLARFNLDKRNPNMFYGLPSPSAATVVFGLLLAYITDHDWWNIIGSDVVLYSLILLLPFLMLTNLQLWSLKGLGVRRGGWILTGLMVMALTLFIATGTAGLVLTVCGYILFGILNLFLKVY